MSIGFGIVGCGVISSWHARAVQKLRLSLVGAYDKHIEACQSFALNYGIKAFITYEDMLSCPDIDCVCICTPSGLHASLAIAAANSGKHIIVEKPMALNVEDADRVIDACNKNNVKLCVISQLRFTEAAEKTKDAIEKGLLGRLVMGDIVMKYYRSQEYYDKSAWRGTWAMDGGGALMNQGIHGIDLLLHLMGPVKSVFAKTKTIARSIETEDTASCVLEFENGALGVIQGTTSIYPGYPRLLSIHGDKGSIVLQEDAIVKWDFLNNITEKLNIKSDINSSSNPEAIGIQGHILQINDMVRAIEENRRPKVDGIEARKPIELICAIYESSRQEKIIYLNN